jgi:hypothetical protein
MSETNHEEVHRILTTEFTDRYLRRSGFDNLAFSLPYDPDNPLCDYDQTTWKAKPNARLGLPIGKLILAKTHRLSLKELNELEITAFAEEAADLTEALHDFPVLLVNGHDPDMQAALTLVLLSGIAIARRDDEHGRGRFPKNFEDMVRISHVVGTRGFGPIEFGRPRVPILSLVRISQMVMNPHLSFPVTERMRQSNLPASFTTAYNDLFKSEFLYAVRMKPAHPNGYHSLASTPPSGAPDAQGLDQDGNLITVTRRVSPGTIELIRNMRCGLLPVYAKFGRGKGLHHIELGQIIPPDEVSDATVPDIMFAQAAFRRTLATGDERPVYYEDDPNVATILRDDTKTNT